VTSSIDIAGQPISSWLQAWSPALPSQTVTTSSVSSCRRSLGPARNITGILHANSRAFPLRRAHSNCARQFIPEAPASLVVTHLHYERWICPPGWKSPQNWPLPTVPSRLSSLPRLSQMPASDLEISHVMPTDRFATRSLGLSGATLRQQIAHRYSRPTEGADLKATLHRRPGVRHHPESAISGLLAPAALPWSSTVSYNVGRASRQFATQLSKPVRPSELAQQVTSSQ